MIRVTYLAESEGMDVPSLTMSSRRPPEFGPPGNVVNADLYSMKKVGRRAVLEGNGGGASDGCAYFVPFFAVVVVERKLWE